MTMQQQRPSTKEVQVKSLPVDSSLNFDWMDIERESIVF